MKVGFYISMGISIGALVVGFVLLNDIQQEKENQNFWIQKIPKQCNDVWESEIEEFYELNPELQNADDEKSKNILETIIKNHYETKGIEVLDLVLELNVYEDIRCESCDCLSNDKLSMKIPQNQLELLPPDEGWENKN